MGLITWWSRLLGKSRAGTQGRMRDRVEGLRKDSADIYKSLQALASKRADVLRYLGIASGRDEARVIGQQLVALDLEEQGLRPKWDMVEKELLDLQKALVIVGTTTTPREVRDRQRFLRRLEDAIKERASAENQLRETEKKSWGTVQANQEFIQQVRSAQRDESPAVEAYVALWQQAQAEAAPHFEPREPPAPT